jgi:hypothetical protein
MPQTIFRSQLNKFVELLVSNEIFQNGFELVQDLSKTELIVPLPLRVVHLKTQFYFEVEGFNEFFRVGVLPGHTPEIETDFLTNWSHVVDACGEWISRVKREVGQPDPWLLLKQGQILVEEIPATDQEEKITPQEQERIEEFVRSLKQFIKDEVNPNDSQLKLVDEKLTYLLESARRQGKRDWAHTAVGVVFTIAIGLAMAPEQANKLIHLTSIFLRTLFIKFLLQ